MADRDLLRPAASRKNLTPEPPIAEAGVASDPSEAAAGRAAVRSDPRPPSAALRWSSNLVLFPLIALATVLFGMASLIASLWDRSGRQQHRIAQAWARTLLRLSLSPVQIVGGEHLRAGQAAVYAANHLSYMDTPLLFASLPFQFRILAKQGLWKLPFIGWHLHRSGQVAVDQTSARSSIASLSRGAAALKAGMPLLLFPEGGRSATGEMRPFLSGAAYMALRAQVPLVPLTLVGTYELLPIHTYHLRPRPLRLIVGEPIATEGLTTRDADRLTRRLVVTITATYLQHSGL